MISKRVYRVSDSTVSHESVPCGCTAVRLIVQRKPSFSRLPFLYARRVYKIEYWILGCFFSLFFPERSLLKYLLRLTKYEM